MSPQSSAQSIHASVGVRKYKTPTFVYLYCASNEFCLSAPCRGHYERPLGAR